MIRSRSLLCALLPLDPGWKSMMVLPSTSTPVMITRPVPTVPSMSTGPVMGGPKPPRFTLVTAKRI